MQRFIHNFDELTQSGECGWAEARPAYDNALMRRLASALAASEMRAENLPRDVWTTIVDTHHGDLASLREGRLREADDILARAFTTALGHGIQQEHNSTSALRESEPFRNFVMAEYVDKLVALAESVRAIPVYNPEVGKEFSPFLKKSPDELLDRIEQKIGVAIKAPPFQLGVWGLKTRRGIFTGRDFMALYTALRIRSLLPRRDARICEIGGGVGYLAYYCRFLSLHDVTIVDLPTVGALQGYFLMHNIGADRVSLSGEPAVADSVKLWCPAEFHSDQHRWDIVVNTDSLPELGRATALSYLGRIAKMGATFFSINQESRIPRTAKRNDQQERVADLCDKANGFDCVYRAPYWLRRGYVEEFYLPKEPRTLGGVLSSFRRRVFGS
jgi:hypothetical protein